MCFKLAGEDRKLPNAAKVGRARQKSLEEQWDSSKIQDLQSGAQALHKEDKGHGGRGKNLSFL